MTMEGAEVSYWQLEAGNWKLFIRFSTPAKREPRVGVPAVQTRAGVDATIGEMAGLKPCATRPIKGAT